MIARTFAIVALGALVAGPAARAQDAETLESVRNQVIQKWQKIRSMSAKVNTNLEMTIPGRKLKQTGQGTLELVRRDAKTFFRQELQVNRSIVRGASEHETSGLVVMLCDGEFSYQIDLTRPARKTAEKRRSEDAPQRVGGRDLFDSLAAYNKLALAENAIIDDHPCWVIHAIPQLKDPSPTASAMQKFYLRKEEGVVAKIEDLDRTGRIIATTTYSEFKFDQQIDPKRFKFDPPADVVVTDMTQAAPAPQP